jgi:hypothetical protein
VIEDFPFLFHRAERLTLNGKFMDYLESHQMMLYNAENLPDSNIVLPSFIVDSLAQLIVTEKFRRTGLQHIRELHSFFSCENTGYRLYDHIEGTEIKDYKWDRISVHSFMNQLLVFYMSLKEFNLNQETFNNILLVPSECSYMYENVHITGPFTLCITHLNKVSLTINNVRVSHYFSPKNLSLLDTDDHLEYGIDNDSNDEEVCGEIGNHRYNKIRVNNAYIKELSVINRLGFPLLGSSLDIYCYILTAMSVISFRDVVYEDEELYSIWSSLWDEQDLPNIERMLEMDVTSVNLHGLLNEVWLRCDVLKHVWEMFRR